jgi:anti-sigma B factor antagonist
MSPAEVNVSLRPLPGGVVALDLRGFVDKHTVHALDQAIARLLEQGRNKLVVNCRALDYISSDGMGVFLSHLIKIRKTGGDIKFCAMNREARTVVNVLGLGNLLQVHDSEEAALRDFQQKAREREERERAAQDDEKLSVALRYLDGEVCVAALRGFIDRHTIDLLEKNLRKALEDDHPKLVVNCEGLTYISSNGMGVFIAYVQKARSRGGDIRFCHMRDIARTVITMLGLQNIFRVYETEAEAVASYGAS